MRKADFSKNHIEFVTWILWYGDFIYRLVEAKRVVRTKYEKLELIEALVLRCAVRWENLVMEDIITSLNRDPSAYASALGLRLRKHLSRDECKAILQGHQYVDFRTVEEVKSFGKKYLTLQHNPFAGITKSDARKINEFLIIRNLLAHYSDYAWRSYNKFMENKYRYQRVPEPGAFLISGMRNGKYRWSEYLLTFIKTSDDMMKVVT